MLNEEEIEKAKGWLSALDIKSEFEAISKEKLLQYIDELEEYLEKISKQLDNIAIDQIPIGIAELQQENNKQSKIIDLMADIIKDCDIDYSYICKYRIVRSCEKAPKGCKNCIKQYFEKKVEEK